MKLHLCCPGQELDAKVPVAHSVDAILAHSLKAQLTGQHMPVQRERTASQSPRAKGKSSGSVAHTNQPLPVPLELPIEREQPVTEQHRLRLLKVRVARHDRVQVLLGLVQQSSLQAIQSLLQYGQLAQQIQPQVGADLVVARAAGVELAGHRAHQLAQSPLDRGVDILVRRRWAELARAELFLHSSQARQQLVALRKRNQSRAMQRRGVGTAARDIGLVETPVKWQRVAKLAQQVVRCFVKAATPERHGLCPPSTMPASSG